VYQIPFGVEPPGAFLFWLGYAGTNFDVDVCVSYFWSQIFDERLLFQLVWSCVFSADLVEKLFL